MIVFTIRVSIINFFRELHFLRQVHPHNSAGMDRNNPHREVAFCECGTVKMLTEQCQAL